MQCLCCELGLLKDDSIGLGYVCREECVPKIGVYIRTASILESNPVVFPVLFLVFEEKERSKYSYLLQTII